MQIQVKDPHSARVLGAVFAAVALLVPTVLAALLPGKTDALVLLALMLPLLMMGALDAALPQNNGPKHS